MPLGHNKGTELPIARCPFCGSGAEVASTRAAGLEWWAVECGNEECLAHGPERGGEAEAISAWNTRPSPEVDALRIQRKWLIEQLAGAWGWTEQEVSKALFRDCRTATLANTPAQEGE